MTLCSCELALCALTPYACYAWLRQNRACDRYFLLEWLVPSQKTFDLDLLAWLCRLASLYRESRQNRTSL